MLALIIPISGGHPDQGLPGSPPGFWGGGGVPMPTPPIYLPPGGGGQPPGIWPSPPVGIWPSPPVGIWPNPPGGGGHPDQGLPMPPGGPTWGGSRPGFGGGHPDQGLPGGGGHPDQGLPPAGLHPSHPIVRPGPDSPTIPPNKELVIVWVPGHGWTAHLVDAPPAAGVKPPDQPGAGPKR